MKGRLARCSIYTISRLVRHRAVTLQTAVVTHLAAAIPQAQLDEYDKVFDAFWLVSLGTAQAAAVRRARSGISWLI